MPSPPRSPEILCDARGVRMRNPVSLGYSLDGDRGIAHTMSTIVRSARRKYHSPMTTLARQTATEVSIVLESGSGSPKTAERNAATTAVRGLIARSHCHRAERVDGGY